MAHRQLPSSNNFPQAAEADMRHIGHCSQATDFLKQPKQTCDTSAAALKQPLSSSSRSRPATHRPLISSNGFPQAAEADMRHIGRCSLAAAFLKQPKQTCDTAAATLSQPLSLGSRSRHATHRPQLSSNRFPQAAEADMQHIGCCSLATDFLKQPKQTCDTSAAAL